MSSSPWSIREADHSPLSSFPQITLHVARRLTSWRGYGGEADCEVGVGARRQIGAISFLQPLILKTLLVKPVGILYVRH